MKHRLFALSCCALAPLSTLVAQENGELGRMWTFDKPPLAYLEQEYGFKPDQAWLDRVRLASLRYGEGCSSSFVSPKGLIMTNHHCMRDNIASVQGANDWIRDGFVAAALEDEVRIPELAVRQLVQMVDITEQVDAGVLAADDEQVVDAKRDANRERVLAAARGEYPGLEPEIVELFQGARYQLYVYKVWDDVRLVMAPHLQTAHFGGDPDNFTYPRWGIDFGFVRAYEDGAPAETSEHYFRWSEHGPQPNGLVFVTGNPGSTSRLLTFAQMEHVRDATHARVLQMLDNRIVILKRFMDSSPDLEKRFRTTMLSWQNGQKAYRGELAGLRSPDFMAHKKRAERAFRARIDDSPELAAQYGGLWDEIATVAAAQTALDGPLNFQTGGGSPHVEKAIAIVRAVRAAELGSEGAGELASMALMMPVRFNPIRRDLFVDHLVRATTWLPANDPYLRLMLAGRSPAEAEEWIASSRVSDPDYVAELLAGGPEAVLTSRDPAIEVARFLVPRIDANNAANAELEARAAVLGTKIGRALFAAYGDDVSPDATFTLRISDGVVKGYDYNGTVAPWRTSFFGLYGRNEAFGDQYPFDLPGVWKDRRDRVDLAKPVDFVCTVDSTGGNSGSPVIDAGAEIVGLLFDGNIESLPNEFLFDDEAGRSVCVHVHAILEALTKIYDADRVVAELQGVESR